MRLASDQIRRLAERIVHNLSGKGLVEVRTTELKVLEGVETVLSEYVALAKAVEEEVRKVMDKHSSQIASGNIDNQKIHSMIRKEVASRKKFDLHLEDQVSTVAHQIHDRLYHNDLVDYTDEDKALRLIKNILAETIQAEEFLDSKVREKIASLKRGVDESSPEWQILYRKYMNEELAKKGV